MWRQAAHECNLATRSHGVISENSKLHSHNLSVSEKENKKKKMPYCSKYKHVDTICIIARHVTPEDEKCLKKISCNKIITSVSSCKCKAKLKVVV